MASSRPSETSLIMHGARHSAFTAELLEGLTGATDPHGEGVIKVFDLFDYVASRVAQTTYDTQHPIFKASQLEQNFPIALNHRGAKASSASYAGSTPETNIWQELAKIIPTLYPTCPSDCSGGGAVISISTLVDTSLKNFQKHNDLLDIRRRL